MMMLWWKVCNFWNLLRGVGDMLRGSMRPVGRLNVVVTRVDGRQEDYGVVSTRVVTTAGVNAIVDGLQGTFTISDFKYHGMGTGSVAESSADTALGTQVESRATGTQTEGASANVYRSVATITATATRAITEHGLFSASTSGTLLDRSVFSTINLSSGDSIQFTYELTVPAGS